ncbi:hypothetical protein EV693_11114 [Nicoletella semolina]|uniref:Uncharacterized protein n=1 Tax=Nicoletella semolina TaxID=271160 RepID=A0A4R2N6C3_9PAST|nr:hypothetical protein [Nicoletella semolina]TCP16479.1 hypothetical protein EV693_11114 [Nicoletella semolina]
MRPPAGRHWRVAPVELDQLDEKGLIEWSKNGVPRIKKFADEHKGKKFKIFGILKIQYIQRIRQKKMHQCLK